MNERIDTEKADLERSWLALLREIAKLSDAMGLDSENWSDADDCTLLQEFDPWVVIRRAELLKGCADALEQERADRLVADARIRLLEETGSRIVASSRDGKTAALADARLQWDALVPAPAPKEEGESV